MLIKVRCLLDVTIPKRFNHVVDFFKQKFSVVLPVTDGAGLGHVHVLRLLVLFPVHQFQFVFGPVAFIVVGGVVVLHRDGDDALVVLVEHLLRLLFDLVIAVVGVLIHTSDAFCRIGEGALDEAVHLVVLITQQTLGSCRFLHGGRDEIPRRGVLAVDDVGACILGLEIQQLLDKANITENKNAIPFDPLPRAETSGVRFGTPAITTRGMKEEETEQIGKWILEILEHGDDVTERISGEVKDLCAQHPLYPHL